MWLCSVLLRACTELLRSRALVLRSGSDLCAGTELLRSCGCSDLLCSGSGSCGAELLRSGCCTELLRSGSDLRLRLRKLPSQSLP
jgi:hypothetical protein